MTTTRTPLRKSKLLDMPQPWEDRPISEERWQRHRDAMMAREFPGRRPQEWWVYDAKTERPRDSGDATIKLYEMGALSEAEIATLMPKWREYFEHSYDEHFWYVLGPRKFLEGYAARRAFYRWAGIPPAVLKQLRVVRQGAKNERHH